MEAAGAAAIYGKAEVDTIIDNHKSACADPPVCRPAITGVCIYLKIMCIGLVRQVLQLDGVKKLQ